MPSLGIFSELKKWIPNVGNSTWGLVIFIIDIILPGIGTLIAGCVGNHPKSFIIGILQLILACLLIGWIWSIIWGYLIWKRSKSFIPL